MNSEIPEKILKSFPKLPLIIKAIEQYEKGEAVDVCCPEYNNLLVVQDVPEVGSIWVMCPKGCTNYRESSFKQRKPLRDDKS